MSPDFCLDWESLVEDIASERGITEYPKRGFSTKERDWMLLENEKGHQEQSVEGMDNGSVLAKMKIGFHRNRIAWSFNEDHQPSGARLLGCWLLLAAEGKTEKAASGDHSPVGYRQRARFYSISDTGRLEFSRRVASYIVFLAENSGLVAGDNCKAVGQQLEQYETYSKFLDDISID